MRQFQLIDQVEADANGVLQLTGDAVQVAFKREGEYLAMSYSIGALEMGLRLRWREMTHAISHLQPVEGLQTTRQVGTGQSFLAVGLQSDGSLVLRPTLVTDAGGLLVLNLQFSPEAGAALRDWVTG